MNENEVKSRSEWVTKQKLLLEFERKAEVEASRVKAEDVSLKQLQAKGIALGRLLISERSTGLFGHPTLVLSPKCAPGIKPLLPSHSFSSGDVVGLWENKGAGGALQICAGVVSRVSASFIQVALDDEVPQLDSFRDDAQFRLHKLANDVTYRRIKRGLESLEAISSGPSTHLVGVLFSETDLYQPLPFLPPILLDKERSGLVLFNKCLDVSQQEAVKFSLTQKELAVIHGPPGTGKTTTLIEVILQHVKMNCKVLAVAPSNLAVDNMLERLSAAGAKVVRIGHPARASKGAQLRTLDALIQCSDDYTILQDIRKDIGSSLNALKKVKDKGQRRRIREEIKIFRKELRDREMRLSREIIKNSSVVLTTLTSAGNEGPLKILNEGYFDLTVIDECSQGLEASCYLSVLKTSKLLIAGDHRQLPPTVLSPEASSQGFLVSLMERIIALYGHRVTRMLKVQYRMNSTIMDWASCAMYDNQLEAHVSVASHLLCQMEDVEKNEDTETALVLIDTAGCDLEEMSGEDLSKGNEGEAAIVTSQVKSLLAAGVKEKDVAVITPYNLQVELIRGQLHDSHPGVEIRSVDGFQGREKEAIVMSLVRSNKRGEIGFLSEDRRLNVAVTRARRHLTLVCDSDTVSRHKFIAGLIEHITTHGLVKSGHEFQEEVSNNSGRTSHPHRDFSSHLAKDGPIPKQKTSNEQRKSNKNETPEAKKARERESEERKKEYESKVGKFLKSSSTKLEFPPNLNSFERLLIHEIAGRHQLLHESHGEGKERHIVLLKPTKETQTIPSKNLIAHSLERLSPDAKELIENDLTPDDLNEKTNLNLIRQDGALVCPEGSNVGGGCEVHHLKKEVCKKKKHKSKTNLNTTDVAEQPQKSERCQICRKEILVQSLTLHLLQCEKRQKNHELKKEINRKLRGDKSVKKKEGKDQMAKGARVEEDFDTIIAQFKKENNSCAFPRCKNPTVVLFQQCPYCRHMFCLGHHQAEVHGCGEEARHYARTVLIKSVKNGVLTPGSGIPSKKPNEVKRALLHRKLDKKLNEMSSQRKAQPSSTKDKS